MAGKRVVVIASGEIERRALPHLLKHLAGRGIALAGVRIPPRHNALTPVMAARLIKAAWFASLHEPPSKFVVLLDTDRASPLTVVERFERELPNLVTNVGADVLYAYAQQHLEAWYFGDPGQLRTSLGRDLGAVDLSQPDQIENPKLHLKHLLHDRVYTARVSEEIARRLAPESIIQRSPSFSGFVAAVANGRRESPSAVQLLS